ncbi:MAG: hypothetical protein ACMUHB_02550 [Thermoplasmatota archaeon]
MLNLKNTLALMIIIASVQLYLHADLIELAGNRELDSDIGVHESYVQANGQLDEDGDEWDGDYSDTTVEDTGDIHRERAEGSNILIRNGGRVLKMGSALIILMMFPLLVWGFRSETPNWKIWLGILMLFVAMSITFGIFQAVNLGPTNDSVYGDAFHLDQYWDMLTFRFEEIVWAVFQIGLVVVISLQAFLSPVLRKSLEAEE